MRLKTGEELRSWEGHSDCINCVTITPDGNTAISASSDKTLVMWDVKTGKRLRSLEGHTSGVSCVAVTPWRE